MLETTALTLNQFQNDKDKALPVGTLLKQFSGLSVRRYGTRCTGKWEESERRRRDQERLNAEVRDKSRYRGDGALINNRKIGKVNRLHTRIEPFPSLFWALGIVLAHILQYCR